MTSIMNIFSGLSKQSFMVEESYKDYNKEPNYFQSTNMMDFY